MTRDAVTRESTTSDAVTRESTTSDAVTRESTTAGAVAGSAAAEIAVALRVNGETQTLVCEPRVTLADALREHLHLTGTHLGCEHGVCGACTVLIDGQPVRSCLMFAIQAQTGEITTIEGLTSDDGALHPVQDAFSECHGLQCGYCTPGFVLTAVHLLGENPEPTRDQIRRELSGNICRCTGYVGIVDAVELAARNLTGE